MTVTVMNVILCFGMLAAGCLLLYLLLDQRSNSMRDYILVGLCGSIVALLGYWMELNTSMYSGKMAAVQIGYLGKLYIGPVIVCFALQYYKVQIKWFFKLLLFVLPSVIEVFIFTCDRHKLYYKGISIMPSGMLDVTPGPLYYVSMGYTIVMGLTYMGICLYHRKGLTGEAKTLNTLYIVSALIPPAALVMYMMKWTNSLDVTPLGLMLSTWIMSFAILRFGMLDKDAMLQNMSTALIFMSKDNHLIYANSAAYNMLPALRAHSFSEARRDLSVLLLPAHAVMQVGGKSYQRKITQFTDSSGREGKLLTFDDITEMNAQLARDSMTGLYNHAYFYRTLEPAMEQAAEEKTPLTVAIADIDSFKRINDTFGHANGDIILITLASLLQDVCAGSDVYRYGGEEFAVIFHLDYAAAESVMHKALERFSQLEFPFMDRNVTFSYGCAQFDGNENSAALFDRADQLMYARKNALHEKERQESVKADKSADEKVSAAKSEATS